MSSEVIVFQETTLYLLGLSTFPISWGYTVLDIVSNLRNS